MGKTILAALTVTLAGAVAAADFEGIIDSRITMTKKAEEGGRLLGCVGWSERISRSARSRYTFSATPYNDNYVN